MNAILAKIGLTGLFGSLGDLIKIIKSVFGIWNLWQSYKKAATDAEAEKRGQERDAAVDGAAAAKTPEEIFAEQEKVAHGRDH